MVIAALLITPAPAVAQNTGSIIGRITDEATGAPVAAAEIAIEGTRLLTLTSERGDFVFTQITPGTHRLRVSRLGFRTTIVPVRVRAGRTTQLSVDLPPAPVEVEGITAAVERQRLIEPEVTVSHDLILGRELRTLPVDEVAEAVELATGVSDGHFRGGRVGQEVYVIDGIEVKNQLESSTGTGALELPPTALAEIDVVTGGLGAEVGSALSGVVSYVTRRGNREHWEGRIAVAGDHWMPDALFRGFSSLSASASGPLRPLGDGTTLFADVLAQGLLDAEPRARGLTCVRPEDGDAELREVISTLADDRATRHLYCPFSADRLPHQRGDKLLAFARLDRPLGSTTNLTLSALYNRRQQELFTPEFKYNAEHQLGQREKGYLGSLSLEWGRQARGRLYSVSARVSALRLDRYLGVVDPWTFSERDRIAGFGIADFRFLGEPFVKSPIADQLASAAPVPGYERPGGTTGSPFGPAAQGIFFTRGTPGIASWNRSEFIGADVGAQVLWAGGHAIRTGGSIRFYQIESYERVTAFVPGSSLSFARFHPTTLSAFAELSLLTLDEITVRVGGRLDAFESSLGFQDDVSDLFAPVIDSGWRVELMPRLGVAAPLPGTEGRWMFRFNYAQVAQPPDFRFFLDTTLGDSLRVDIARQGNPRLSFERATTWEAAVSHLLSRLVSVDVTVYMKSLGNLVTSAGTFADVAQSQFSTADFGSVKGLELSARLVSEGVRARVGYGLQSARGTVSSAFEDPGDAASARRLELPLAFDRRHTADLIVAVGEPAEPASSGWGVTLTGSLRSGVPLDRGAEAIVDPTEPGKPERLPWTARINLRATRDFGRLPGCRDCVWGVMVDTRNLLGRDNVIALRRDTGSVAPSAEEVLSAADDVPDDMPGIPRESADYSKLIDLDGDGLISADEMRTARVAAALDRADPSLFFGEARSIRVGLEIRF